MQKQNQKEIRPLLILFILLNLFFLLGRSWLKKKGVDADVVIIGNSLLMLLMYVSYQMTVKSLSSTNPQHFVRAVYGSFLLKFFVLAIAAFIYIMVVREKVNKPGLIVCLGLYVVYTVLEVRGLQQLLKRIKNGKA